MQTETWFGFEILNPVLNNLRSMYISMCVEDKSLRCVTHTHAYADPHGDHPQAPTPRKKERTNWQPCLDRWIRSWHEKSQEVATQSFRKRKTKVLKDASTTPKNGLYSKTNPPTVYIYTATLSNSDTKNYAAKTVTRHLILATPMELER